jgi:hypothetical protein
MSKLAGLFITDAVANLTDGRAAGLLDVAQDATGGRWVFAQGSGTIAAYDVVAINSSGVAQAATSALAKAAVSLAVAPVAVTSASYAWFQTKGNCVVNVLSTCSSGVALYTSGTAGKLDDTTTSQVNILSIATLADVTAATSTAAVIRGDLNVLMP